jgi:hypothetical protein
VLIALAFSFSGGAFAHAALELEVHSTLQGSSGMVPGEDGERDCIRGDHVGSDMHTMVGVTGNGFLFALPVPYLTNLADVRVQRIPLDRSVFRCRKIPYPIEVVPRYYSSCVVS